MASKDQKTGKFCLVLSLQIFPLTSELNGAAILSVYNKQGLLDLAKGLIKNNVRLLASGGTASLIRNAGFDVE